jgi:metal-dependent amidase/aminoacylase/carboxypeptidase family protein
MTGLNEIPAGYDGRQAHQEAFSEDLHQHPELSHQEHRTGQRAAPCLQDHGLTVHDGHRRHQRGGPAVQRKARWIAAWPASGAQRASGGTVVGNDSIALPAAGPDKPT